MLEKTQREKMADNFIGSKISLVSKSDIRYEGFVSNINTLDSTIALNNVKSFGTEGRKTDGPQVPPTDHIYEYILFRGSDIKDLQVKASPPVQTTPPTVNDPAIIEMHCSPMTVPPNTGSGALQTCPPNLNQTTMKTHTYSIHETPAISSSIPLTNMMPNSEYPIPFNTSLNGEMTPLLITPSHFLPNGMDKDISSSPQPMQSAHENVEVVQVSHSEPMHSNSQPPLLPLPLPSAEKLSKGGSRARQDNRGRFERGRRNGRFQPATRFTKEFDFEAMNEKFNKDEVWGHLGKSNEAQDGEKFVQDGKDNGPSESEAMPVYSKDEFFDSLSCKSLDRGSHNGRIKHSERIKLDAETFGDVARHGDGRGVLGSGRGAYMRGGYIRGGYMRGGYMRGGYMRGSYRTTGHGYTGKSRGPHS